MPSYVWLCDPIGCSPRGSSVHTGVGCHFFLQGIFLTQGSNLCPLYFLHCRQVLYHWATWETHINSISCLLHVFITYLAPVLTVDSLKAGSVSHFTLYSWLWEQALPFLGCSRWIYDKCTDGWMNEKYEGLFPQGWRLHSHMQPLHTLICLHNCLPVLDCKAPWVLFTNLFSSHFSIWHILGRKKLFSVLLGSSGWSKN